MRHPISKPTAGRSEFETGVAAKNASVETQLNRATRKSANDRETDFRSIEIHIRCRYNQRALWAVRILERHPISKPTAGRSKLRTGVAPNNASVGTQLS